MTSWDNSELSSFDAKSIFSWRDVILMNCIKANLDIEWQPSEKVEVAGEVVAHRKCQQEEACKPGNCASLKLQPTTDMAEV